MPTNIDPAIVEAAQNVGPSCPECGHLIGAHSHDVGCMDSMTEGLLERGYLGFCPCERSSLDLIAAAVDAARAEGDKQGAARVREAGEAVLDRSYDHAYDREDYFADGYRHRDKQVRRALAALTEAAPHD